MENNRPLLGERKMELESPIDLNDQISAYLDGETNPTTFESECEEDVVETSNSAPFIGIR